MSISLMTAVWRLGGLSPTQKLVLLSLADNANDQGECYPSVAQIGQRTCLSERATRDAIRSLERVGIVTSIARSGTSTVYFLSIPDWLQAPDSAPTATNAPRHLAPPAPAAGAAPAGNAPRQQVPPTPAAGPPPPRQQVPPTPAAAAPKPSLNRQLNRQGTVNRPECVPERVWSDYLAIRAAKRAPMTETALRGLEREAAKAGMTLPDAIRECCERGWQSFRAAWLVSGQQARASPRRETTEEHNRRAFDEWLGDTHDDGRTIDA